MKTASRDPDFQRNLMNEIGSGAYSRYKTSVESKNRRYTMGYLPSYNNNTLTTTSTLNKSKIPIPVNRRNSINNGKLSGSNEMDIIKEDHTSFNKSNSNSNDNNDVVMGEADHQAQSQDEKNKEQNEEMNIEEDNREGKEDKINVEKSQKIEEEHHYPDNNLPTSSKKILEAIHERPKISKDMINKKLNNLNKTDKEILNKKTLLDTDTINFDSQSNVEIDTTSIFSNSTYSRICKIKQSFEQNTLNRISNNNFKRKDSMARFALKERKQSLRRRRLSSPRKLSFNLYNGYNYNYIKKQPYRRYSDSFDLKKLPKISYHIRRANSLYHPKIKDKVDEEESKDDNRSMVTTRLTLSPSSTVQYSLPNTSSLLTHSGKSDAMVTEPETTTISKIEDESVPMQIEDNSIVEEDENHIENEERNENSIIEEDENIIEDENVIEDENIIESENENENEKGDESSIIDENENENENEEKIEDNIEQNKDEKEGEKDSIDEQNKNEKEGEEESVSVQNENALKYESIIEEEEEEDNIDQEIIDENSVENKDNINGNVNVDEDSLEEENNETEAENEYKVTSKIQDIISGEEEEEEEEEIVDEGKEEEIVDKGKEEEEEEEIVNEGKEEEGEEEKNEFDLKNHVNENGYNISSDSEIEDHSKKMEEYNYQDPLAVVSKPQSDLTSVEDVVVDPNINQEISHQANIYTGASYSSDIAKNEDSYNTNENEYTSNDIVNTEELYPHDLHQNGNAYPQKTMYHENTNPSHEVMHITEGYYHNDMIRPSTEIYPSETLFSDPNENYPDSPLDDDSIIQEMDQSTANGHYGMMIGKKRNLSQTSFDYVDLRKKRKDNKNNPIVVLNPNSPASTTDTNTNIYSH